MVARKLREAGANLRCLLRATSDVARLAGVTYDRAAGDMRDKESLRQAAKGCQAAVHLAGLSSWDQIDSPMMKDVTEGGTRNLLECARDLGLRKVVFVSTAAAVNGSDQPKVFDENAPFELESAGLSYSNHKRAAEKICMSFAAEGLPVTIVNPAEVYGPHDTALVTAGNLIDFAKSSPVMVCAGGTSVAHVDDVALGVVRALERGRCGERYILGGENLTVRQLAELTLELLHLKKRVVQLPNAIIRGVARGGLVFGVPLPFNPRVIPYATRYWFVDSGKAQRELGVTFRPARDALASTLAWLQETGRIA